MKETTVFLLSLAALMICAIMICAIWYSVQFNQRCYARGGVPVSTHSGLLCIAPASILK